MECNSMVVHMVFLMDSNPHLHSTLYIQYHLILRLYCALNTNGVLSCLYSNTSICCSRYI